MKRLAWTAAFAAVTGLHFGAVSVGSLPLNLLGSTAPLFAGICCSFATAVSKGAERRTWALFTAGCILWFIGMLAAASYEVKGTPSPYPGKPDFALLLGALCVFPGMFNLAVWARRNSGIDLWNFVLVASGGALAIFALCLPLIATSTLSTRGAAFALTFPAIWTAAACTAIVSLVFSVAARRRLEMLLIAAAFAIHAVADVLYTLSLTASRDQLPTFRDGFWVIAFGLLAWGAIVRGLRGRDEDTAEPIERSSERHPAEAFYPATIVAGVSIAAAVAGAQMGRTVALLAIPVALIYAFAIGAREYLALSTERKLRRSAEASVHKLAESKQQLSDVLESTTDSVVLLDRDWNISYLNWRAKDTLRGGRKLEVGCNLWDLYPEEAGGPFEQMYRKALEEQRPVEFIEYLPAEGIWLEVHAVPTQVGLSLFFRDVSASRKAEEEITKLAYQDSLTGLGNRAIFQRRLEESIQDARGGVALLCLDLDHFKEVNDSYGHAVGDALLKEVAIRLQEVTGEGPVLARLGGDEFAVLIDDVSDAMEQTALARRIIAALARPYQVDDLSITVGSSVGIAVCPHHAETADELFCNADTALYFAKSTGRGHALVFQPSMTEQVRWRQSLRADLIQAINQHQFHVVYQPIIDLQSDQTCGVEALVRWKHRERGEVPPSAFIPVAEESGLINAIGEWVLEAACREATHWPPHIGLSVNLSPSQLNDSLPDRVSEIVRRTNLPAARLSLEVTESVLLNNQEEAVRLLSALRNLGVRISLDDFGTGYSSLSYLRTFPFDAIKIDRSFIVDHESPISEAVIRAVVDIGRTLGSSVIAEGVETRQQLDAVRRAGCSKAQGYFFSPPIEAVEVLAEARRVDEAAIWWNDRPRRA